MLGGFRIGSIRGIPIRIHFTLLLILPLLAYAFSRTFSEAARVADIPPEQLAGSPLVWGAGMALALFFSVLLHELAHSLYALSKGGKVKDITLLMIGGVSSLTESPKESRHEAIMAAAGPLTSLAIGGALLGLNAVLDFSLFNVRFALFYLGSLNIVLGLFNLLPAFPMDGGRILRALLSPRMGIVRATKTSATVGKVFAVGFGLIGLLSFNLILMLVAFFIFAGAEGESRQVQLKAALDGVRVREVMRSEVATIPADHSAREAVEYLLQNRKLSVVVRRSGSYSLVTLEALERIPAEQRQNTELATVSLPLSTLGPDEPASRALQLLMESKAGRVLVVESEQLLGILTQEDLLRALKLRELEDTQKRRVGWRQQQV